MKIKIIIVLKSNALAVFHSHWSNFAAMKPLLFLIGSTDQLDAFCGTVSQLFEFWLNVSFRPPGKQKTANFCALLECVKTWWPSVTTVTCFLCLEVWHDVCVFALYLLLLLLFFCCCCCSAIFLLLLLLLLLLLCCYYFSVTAVADIIFLMLLLLLIFSDATATIVAADVYAVTIFYSADASNFCCSCYCYCCCCC